jgi:ClpP class serine protease
VLHVNTGARAERPWRSAQEWSLANTLMASLVDGGRLPQVAIWVVGADAHGRARRRGSREIGLIHRQETMGFLGFPIARYIDVEDSEAILRAIHLTEPSVLST